MTETQEKKKPLSGSILKLIAVITMLIDHSHHVLENIPGFRRVFWNINPEYQVSAYLLFRTVGRIAFPIYAFLLTEGFQHTHDRKKYASNLFLFALISEIPWNLLHGGSVFYKSQNVFFTLFLGLLCMIVYETYQQEHKKQLLYLIIIAVIAVFLNADYGLKGVGFIFAMYLLREKKIRRCLFPRHFCPDIFSIHSESCPHLFRSISIIMREALSEENSGNMHFMHSIRCICSCYIF